MQCARADDQVVAADELVQLSDRDGDLAMDALVHGARIGGFAHDPVRGHVRQKRGTPLQPCVVNAQTKGEPGPLLGDLASEIRPHWYRARRAHNMARGPGITRVGIGIAGKRRALAGQIPKVPRVAKLADASLDLIDTAGLRGSWLVDTTTQIRRDAL
jgi:hypothetical protein